MKTILNINGQKLLLPATAELAKVFEMLKGVKVLQDKTLYGPEKARYAEPYYVNRFVCEDRAEKFGVQIVHDEEVISSLQFVELEKSHKAICAEFEAKQASDESAVRG